MNYDNQRLMYIQTMKKDLLNRIDECKDKQELQELKQNLEILREDERQILESMDYLR